MSNRLPSNNPSAGWKNQTYLVGAAVGLLFGLVSAYMYTRAAEDDVSSVGVAHRASAGEILGLGLAALALVRQVAEMGRGPDDKKKRK
jgi:hypothetical protein